MSKFIHDINLTGNRIINLGNPIDLNDGVNKDYLLEKLFDEFNLCYFVNSTTGTTNAPGVCTKNTNDFTEVGSFLFNKTDSNGFDVTSIFTQFSNGDVIQVIDSIDPEKKVMYTIKDVFINATNVVISTYSDSGVISVNGAPGFNLCSYRLINYPKNIKTQKQVIHLTRNNTFSNSWLSYTQNGVRSDQSKFKLAEIDFTEAIYKVNKIVMSHRIVGNATFRPRIRAYRHNLNITTNILTTNTLEWEITGDTPNDGENLNNFRNWIYIPTSTLEFTLSSNFFYGFRIETAAGSTQFKDVQIDIYLEQKI